MAVVEDGAARAVPISRFPRQLPEPSPVVHENDVIRVSGKNDNWREVGVRVAHASCGNGVAAMRAVGRDSVYCASRAFIHARSIVSLRGLDLTMTMGYQKVPGNDGQEIDAIIMYAWARTEASPTWETAPSEYPPQ
jgi:stage V sporulation protein SpoVS